RRAGTEGADALAGFARPDVNAVGAWRRDVRPVGVGARETLLRMEQQTGGPVKEPLVIPEAVAFGLRGLGRPPVHRQIGGRSQHAVVPDRKLNGPSSMLHDQVPR